MNIQKAPMFKKIRRFERKHLTHTRKKDWYVLLRTIVLLPLVIVMYLWYSVLGFFKSNKLLKKDKPLHTIKLSNIVAGFGNLAFPNKEVEAIALKRAEICAECPNAVPSGLYNVIADNKTKQIQGMKCDMCSCDLSAKVRSVNDTCPRGNW